MSKLLEAAAGAVGDKNRIRALRDKVALEVKGLDPIVTGPEIKASIATHYKIGERNAEQIIVKTIRTAYAGTRMAVLEMPANLIGEIRDTESVKIGYTIAKVRLVPNVVRCFRCHELGHISYSCKTQVNRREICRKCGIEGHSIVGCTAAPRCILCTRRKMPEAKTGYVAGAIACPQYKALIN